MNAKKAFQIEICIVLIGLETNYELVRNRLLKNSEKHLI